MAYMLSTDDRPERWLGRTVRDDTGRTFATVSDVLLDSRSAVAAWVVVRLRYRRWRHHAVPVSLVDRSGDGIRLPVTDSVVCGSPSVRPGQPVTARRELALVGYWRPYR